MSKEKSKKTGSKGNKLKNKVKIAGLGTITIPQTQALLQTSPGAPTPGGGTHGSDES